MYKQLIADGQQHIQNVVFYPRDYVFPTDILSLNKIISFVGARRVGKTTIMKQVIHKLVQSGYISFQQLVWIDANEINPMTFDIHALLVAYFELYPDLTPFFVIDEVHELPDRVRQVFVIYNRGYKILISGSNAHLLSSELSTKLRGKVYDQYITGLSWSEYCRFVGHHITHSSMGVGMTKRLFADYVMYGGFPEVALSPDITIKKGLLKNYFEVLLYKDLIERYHIDKEFVIKYLIQYLATTLTKEYSITNIINQLASQGVTITKPSVYNYLEYLQNIFFVYPIRQQYRQRGGLKYYLHDIGYALLRDNEGIGKKFENVIINHYKHQGESLCFTKNNAGEIDLSTGEYDIQISRQLTPQNLARETESLLVSTKKKKLIYHEKDTGLILPEGIEYVQALDLLS